MTAHPATFVAPTVDESWTIIDANSGCIYAGVPSAELLRETQAYGMAHAYRDAADVWQAVPYGEAAPPGATVVTVCVE